MENHHQRGEPVSAEDDPNVHIKNVCPICGESSEYKRLDGGTMDCTKGHSWHFKNGIKYYGDYLWDDPSKNVYSWHYSCLADILLSFVTSGHIIFIGFKGLLGWTPYRRFHGRKSGDKPPESAGLSTNQSVFVITSGRPPYSENYIVGSTLGFTSITIKLHIELTWKCGGIQLSCNTRNVPPISVSLTHVDDWNPVIRRIC